MRKQSRKWEWIGLIFTLAVGNLLHFVYDWSGESRLVAAFSSVNESVWEHMKLLAVPYILFSLVEWLALRRDFRNVLSAQAAGLPRASSPACTRPCSIHRGTSRHHTALCRVSCEGARGAPAGTSSVQKLQGGGARSRCHNQQSLSRPCDVF